MRCDHCGMDKAHAIKHQLSKCAPPFKVQPHSFTGKHPADKRGK